MSVQQVQAIRADRAVAPPVPWRDRPTPRTLLLAASGLAFVAALVPEGGAAGPALDADLARVLRFMAGLKLALAAGAFLVAWWRLARPVPGWRRLAYVGGPPLALGGSLALLSLHHPGVAAITLHAGFVALLAAALTDQRFFAARHG